MPHPKLGNKNSATVVETIVTDELQEHGGRQMKVKVTVELERVKRWGELPDGWRATVTERFKKEDIDFFYNGDWCGGIDFRETGAMSKTREEAIQDAFSRLRCQMTF